MNISERGLDLIRDFEKCRLKAYRDSGGRWTIGYGHTAGVREGDTITQAQADTFLKADVAATVHAVNGMVKVPVSQCQFDALVDFAFNCGANALMHSTLLKKLNAGDYDGAAAEFLRWDHDNGQRVAGLTKRRTADKTLFEAVA
ncbi:lysozyme [Demequina muriae]|uniref:Lysozyme n=1 Tax=Demequina muriae TaxID=3051664 RepID=A0ABT8GK68_9MICO|nr:lysozyme [Demequina sp. EGI L300058]MDN4481843.1 lysozyme [Demequina sp. EGI L300058]